jgi:hypothetical protein
LTKRQPGLLFIALEREYKMYKVNQKVKLKEKKNHKKSRSVWFSWSLEKVKRI